LLLHTKRDEAHNYEVSSTKSARNFRACLSK
jgi:hypothetical protein